MSEKDDFSDLLDQVLAGSEEACRVFLTQYGPRLLQTVRRRLPKELRPQFDSLDFVQDVWASFFAVPLEERRQHFRQTEELIAFLARVAHNKVVDVVRRRLNTQKQGVRRERALPDPDDSTAACVGDFRDDQPTPSVAVMNQEEWQKLLKNQPPLYRRILLLMRNGKSIKEISSELGLTPRSIQRAMERISARQANNR